MNELEEKNALIVGAELTTADHGCLVGWITLDYGGSGQGFGGHSLYVPQKNLDEYTPTGNFAGHFIWEVLKVAGVTEWSQLVGKPIRVRATSQGIQGIGHIIKDIWFYPGPDFEKMSRK